MSENRKHAAQFPFSLPRASAADIRGRQSVRATFKLSEQAIVALNVVSVHLGIKQKSLFDYLMEDKDALLAMAESHPPENAAKEQRIQKTFVVSQRSLAALDAVTKHCPASRDDLIERSIQRLLPVFEKERTRQKRRAAALTRIITHFNQGVVLMDELRTIVGKEDTLYQSLASVMAAYEKAVADIEKLVDKGKRVSEFPVDELKADRSNR